MRKVVAARGASSNSKLLAVWWYAGGSFIGPEEPLDGPHVEQYGDFLQLGYDHYEVWDGYNPLGIGAEYDELPRGRVLFNAKIRKFVVVGPPWIESDAAFQRDIRLFYGLPETTVFEGDEHYGGAYGR